LKIKKSHKTLLDKTIRRLDAPFFYYDLDGLKEHLDSLAEVMDDSTRLWYACKANPLSAILKVFRNAGFGIDVASKGELDQVLSSGIRPESILTTGPAKSRKYLKELLEEEVSIYVCESLNQCYWLNALAKEKYEHSDKKIKPKVLLRVQLEWEGGTSLLGGNAITPFGEDAQTWKSLDFSKCDALDICGLHVFQWGNILSLSRLNEIWSTIAKKSIALAKELNIDLEILDLGGGIGIPYTSDEKSIHPSQIKESLKELKEKYQLNNVWMELGRYAVGPYGSYATPIVDIKNVRGQDILVLEGGINHIARPALTEQPFPCELYRESDAPLKKFQVHGPLCTALDELGTFELPADTGPGDWLFFHQAGAYGFTEGLSFFLCHNLPAEVIIYEDNLMIPRTPKTPRDWLV
jgi:diaminopimelate decarboxylase